MLHEQPMDKGAQRAFYASRRQARTSAQQAAATRGLLGHARRCEAATIAAFVPVRGEPGSLDVLDELARCARVLLPITGPGPRLRWADYRGADLLVRGPLGLLQPPEPADAVLAEADVVLVPAVAIGLDGSRLGHGGGYYDRALAGLPRSRLVGVVHDDEVAYSLPVDPHDVHVGWLCTPTQLRRLDE